jgi:Zn-dependent M16 (insulinase) family peptidase
MNVTFERLDSTPVDALGVRVESFRHPRSGARHLHLASKDDNNVFLVAFVTVPEDSTGIAHILEHVTLCGSERYPVRDPFFMMLRRSLANAMNAFTACDATAYHFASRNPKDFDNLLGVFLDAVFFPLLDPLDFAQEGIRVEFADPGDTGSALVYKGVVFNEMKGAMSAPSAQLEQTLRAHLFPTATYGHNSGGDPAEIPRLRYEDLKAFHARHYRPSNAVFLTYGNLPAAGHQARIESLALSRLDGEAPELRIADERRLGEPVTVQAGYALDAGTDLENKTHIVLSWLLGHSADPWERMKALLLEGVLLDTSAAPLRRALETTSLGNTPSELTGLDTHMREAVFTCGVEGSRSENTQAVEALILEVLDEVVRSGIPQRRAESVLHRIELNHRTLDAGHYPPGMRLLLRALPALLQRTDPLALLDLNPVMERLRQAVREPGFIQSLGHDALLENPHRVRLTLAPDPTLSAQRDAQERARLDALKAGMDAPHQARLVSHAAELEQRQESDAAPDALPTLALADVEIGPPIPSASGAHIGGMESTRFDAVTNGLVHEHVVVDLPPLDADLVDDVPLFGACLSAVGSDGRDYLQTQERQAEVSGGITARIGIRSRVADARQTRTLLVLSGTALERNHGALCELLSATLMSPRFDELPRLHELAAQLRARREEAVTRQGHLLAVAAASAGSGPCGALAHRWEGLQALQHLRELDATLSDESRLSALAERLCRIRDALVGANRQLLSVSEAAGRETFKAELEHRWRDAPPGNESEAFVADWKARAVMQGWSTTSGVNFCAKAYPAVAEGHPDAAALKVLGPFLRNQFLHGAIRERGGAYGGGASYCPDTAAFRFFSYRDPRLGETLADFDAALDWLHSANHPDSHLTEAILSAIAEIDRPLAPAVEARTTFLNALHGRTAEHRQRFRRSVLDVTLDDLRAVASRYLKAETAGIAVISNAERLRQHERPPLDVQTL